MQYYKQFRREPTLAEIDRLGAEYDEKFDTDGAGRAEAVRGDESLNPALGLSKGDPYSRVDYSPATDRFFWLHDNVLAETIEFDQYGDPIERQPEAYDLGDAMCDRYHSRKDCL